jgi:hypothetical protein
MTSILYADDSKSEAYTDELLQKKAELFSAFCIVLGLQLSHGKIRRLFQNFLPNKHKTRATHMTVYTVGWEAHAVPIQSTGSSIFLDAIIDMDNSGADTFQWLNDTAKLACNTIRSKPGFSGASKVAVLSTSTINGMVYKAAASVLSHSQLNDIDSILDNVLITSTQNMHSVPRKLIHIDRKHGGLGIMSSVAKQSFESSKNCLVAYVLNKFMDRLRKGFLADLLGNMDIMHRPINS